jgi:ribosome-associated toxin RatA of RatAB toxin-antitoxin module
MINYSACHKLKIPIKMFFRNVRQVKDYKDFVPWCTNSWEGNVKIENINFDKISLDYPILLKNENSKKLIHSLKKDNEIIKVGTFEGGITVGFNLLDFSYESNVFCIEPNLVFSVTDSSKSNIFQRLESLWIITPHNDEEILVNYEISFQFESLMLSNFTNFFLNFLGENILKAFVQKCNSEITNIEKEELIYSEKEIKSFLDYKFDMINFDSSSEKSNLKFFINNLYNLKILNFRQVENILIRLKREKTFSTQLSFLSENAVWSSHIGVEKILNELESTYLI